MQSKWLRFAKLGGTVFAVLLPTGALATGCATAGPSDLYYGGTGSGGIERRRRDQRRGFVARIQRQQRLWQQRRKQRGGERQQRKQQHLRKHQRKRERGRRRRRHLRPVVQRMLRQHRSLRGRHGRHSVRLGRKRVFGLHDVGRYLPGRGVLATPELVGKRFRELVGRDSSGGGGSGSGGCNLLSCLNGCCEGNMCRQSSDSTCGRLGGPCSDCTNIGQTCRRGQCSMSGPTDAGTDSGGGNPGTDSGGADAGTDSGGADARPG